MRQEYLINDGWLFKPGDVPLTTITGHFATYMNSKAQNGRGPANMIFYDEDFELVTLPHDYVLQGEPSSEQNNSQGFYSRGTAWYRRHFQMPCKLDGKRVTLYFEGAGQKTSVWVNSHVAGSNESMYNSFYMDITPYLLDGDSVNTIAVKIENPQVEGWWYEGAGLYRSVYMIITDVVAVEQWGVSVTPHKVSADYWEIPVKTELYSILDDLHEVTVRQTLLDRCACELTAVEKVQQVRPGSTVVYQQLSVEKPRLWSLEDPYLYTMRTEVLLGKKKLDEVTVNFGFRTIRFDADTGFYLNDIPVKLRGVCLHQDHGNLGNAVPGAVFEYRIKKLKECGMNAIRCAHNNPSPDLLEACDHLGIMVIDENRWFNWSTHAQKELAAMVRRDRNHPCIIIWSVGNEEPLQNTSVGEALVRTLKRFIKTFDNTRPVTIALNGGLYDSYAIVASDVAGINYFIQHYDEFPALHLGKSIVATESGATGSTRGIYFEEEGRDAQKGLVSCYDMQRASFGSSYTEAIWASESHPFIAGTFLWAGIEYRGETEWPRLFCGSGLLDSCGFRKDSFYIAASFWMRQPVLHIMPHWTFPGYEGEIIKVCIYTNQPHVELFLNGKSLGIKERVPSSIMSWNVTYEPGVLSAVAYDDKGREVMHAQQCTAGKPMHLCLVSDNGIPNNSGEDVAIVNVHLEDVDGNFIPDAAYRTFFECDDSGVLLGVSSGNPIDHEDPHRSDKKLFSGRAQGIFRVKQNAASISVTVFIPELAMEETIKIETQKVKPPVRLPICRRKLSIMTFRCWPTADSIEAIERDYNLNDMNTSEPIILGQYHPRQNVGFSVLTARAVMPICEDKLAICFQGLCGNGNIKVFHDKDCWPHPTPKNFVTIRQKFCLKQAKDVKIVLDGFSANEKINIVLALDNSHHFALEDALFCKA